MLLISCSFRIVLEFSSALCLFSSSVWLSIFMFCIEKPNENGFPKVKKSSSYRIWMFLNSNFTPLKSLVKRPIIGGTENSESFLAYFFFCSAAYRAGFFYLSSSSAYLFLLISALYLALRSRLLCFSSCFF